MGIAEAAAWGFLGGVMVSAVGVYTVVCYTLRELDRVDRLIEDQAKFEGGAHGRNIAKA